METRAARPPMSTSKRQEVLEALRHTAPRGLRIAEIATKVECAHVTVRRHVDALREEGLVYRLLEGQPRAVRTDGTRRPGMGYYEYHLTPRRTAT